LQETYDNSLRLIRNGQTTCEKITGEYLRRIEQGNDLNAFLSVLADQALEQAREVDRKLERGAAGSLAGMVVAVKDVLSLRDATVTCGSKILERFVALYDATAVSRLRDQDAILIGKTNMDEFAMGSSSENSAYGPVLNPVDKSRVPGGSSSGSCAAVAAGLAHTALGTDTGGSIRQPAAFCGIVGLKPTYGRVSRYGLVALSSSFDQIGPFANSTADAALVLKAIAGHDERDSTSSPAPVPDYPAHLKKDVKGLRIGVPEEFLGEGLEGDVRNAFESAVDFLRSSGAMIRNIHLPHAKYHISTYYVLMTAEASSNLARFDGARYGYRDPEAKSLDESYVMSRSRGFGAEVKRRIMLGTYVLSAGYYDAYYLKAQKVRRLIQNDFLQAFESVDCILMPTTPTTAFRFGEKSGDPLQMYLSDVFTVSANLAGVPAISVPFGKDGKGLPIGVQVVGRHFDERTILNVGDFLEGARS
jgi:aspartyl-tRNA(Asn)/glutamyl-tRNA(Gln) amidotransferase subunit A